MKLSMQCIIASVTLAFGCSVFSMALGDSDNRNYSDNDLKGEWILSGLLKFAAPVPFPGTHLHDAPPHAQFQAGDKVGLWGTILGTMDFDGKGNVKLEDVFKPGEVEPGPIPFIPPLPELGSGSYVVHSNGMVEIYIRGRDPSSPEDQVDFETDYQCQLNRAPRELTCLVSRFKTFFVDPNGYHAPIAGIITMKKRH